MASVNATRVPDDVAPSGTGYVGFARITRCIANEKGSVSSVVVWYDTDAVPIRVTLVPLTKISKKKIKRDPWLKLFYSGRIKIKRVDWDYLERGNSS